jgi:hypothetical protein
MGKRIVSILAGMMLAVVSLAAPPQPFAGLRFAMVDGRFVVLPAGDTPPDLKNRLGIRVDNGGALVAVTPGTISPQVQNSFGFLVDATGAIILSSESSVVASVTGGNGVASSNGTTPHLTLSPSVSRQTGSSGYTAASTDCGNTIVFANASNQTLTLPQAGTPGFAAWVRD